MKIRGRDIVEKADLAIANLISDGGYLNGYLHRSDFDHSRYLHRSGFDRSQVLRGYGNDQCGREILFQVSAPEARALE